MHLVSLMRLRRCAPKDLNPPPGWMRCSRQASRPSTNIKGDLKIGIYNPAKKKYQAFEKPEGIISLPALHMDEKVVAKNDSASLVDLGDGIVCVEFHSKMNTFDTDIGEMINKCPGPGGEAV